MVALIPMYHIDAPSAKHRTKIPERTKQRRMAFKDYTEVMEPMLLGRRDFFIFFLRVGGVGWFGWVWWICKYTK